MRIRRAIIVPTVLTFAAAGSVLAGAVVPVAAQLPSAVVVAAAPAAHPNVYYNW